MSPELSEPISIQHADSPRKWTFVSKRLRQLRKLIRLLPSEGFRRGLRYGVAASIENHALMKSIRPATLIDVGANVGQFSLLIRTLHPDTYIHAFEPLSRPAGRFARLFKGDDLTTLHRCAIGPLSGGTTMHVTGDDDSSSLLVPVAAKTVGVEQVAVRRLDEVLNGTDAMVRPVLLKLDTQGSELSALRSCGSLLDQVDFVYVEVAFIEAYSDSLWRMKSCNIFLGAISRSPP